MQNGQKSKISKNPPFLGHIHRFRDLGSFFWIFPKQARGGLFGGGGVFFFIFPENQKRDRIWGGLHSRQIFLILVSAKAFFCLVFGKVQIFQVS